MNIGGFQPLTLSDFPGCVAAIVFTQGCNFRCPYCHNSMLLDGCGSACGSVLTDSQILSSLQHRGKMLDGVVISGGEPTLQDGLADFIRQLRAMNFKIKLDTNGSRPEVIRQLLDEKLLDYIAMDIKSPIRKYDRLTATHGYQNSILRSMEIIVNAEIEAEFRTTYVPQLLTPQDMAEIRAMVPEGIKYRMQDFIAQNALDAALHNIDNLKLEQQN